MFVCPGCKARFRVTKAPKSGKIKCPKCGLVSMLCRRPSAPAPPGPPPPPPPELQPNQTIAGHKILEYIGGSEYTGSYKASQISMGRTVLLKALRKKHAANPAVKARFFAGARAAARLNHPHILSVFDMGEENGVCFHTTEFVDGGSLPQFMAREQKLSSEQRLSIATQIAQALAHAESTGVEHVWIGPEDVLLTDKGDVRVRRVGTGAPLGGGTPQPILKALARLLFLTVTGQDLDPDVLQTGDTSRLHMPLARDALASKLYALALKVIQDGGRAFAGTGEVAAELEKLSESARRSGAVHAASAPGGVVPLRTDRARRRRRPVRTALIIAGIAASAIAITAVIVAVNARARRRNQTAGILLKQARQEIQSPATETSALEKFRRLATEYGDTDAGRTVVTQNLIRQAREVICRREFSEAAGRFKDKPRELDQAFAELAAAAARLRRKFPAETALIEQIEGEWRKKIRQYYTNEAIREWNKKTLDKVQKYLERMQYGNARNEAHAFAEKWPESDRMQATVTKIIHKINDKAKKRFGEIMKKVDSLAADGRFDEAEEWLGKVIRNFGIPKYVRAAEAKLAEIKARRPR